MHAHTKEPNIGVLVYYPTSPIISVEERTFGNFFWFFIEKGSIRAYTVEVTLQRCE